MNGTFVEALDGGRYRVGRTVRREDGEPVEVYAKKCRTLDAAKDCLAPVGAAKMLLDGINGGLLSDAERQAIEDDILLAWCEAEIAVRNYHQSQQPKPKEATHDL